MAQAKLATVGVHIPEILLPKPNVDMKKWSVVACDQYTSQPKYWEEVDKIVGSDPSTLRLILPEVYLETDKEEEIIKRVLSDMQTYVKDGILVSSQPGFILLERRTKHEPPRKGLVVALDLECYDYSKGSTTLIRATEGTIVARIPPRLKVRENASIETPHIMVLIDDPRATVIEPLFNLPLEVAYDTELMCNGGHIKGWFVNKQEQLEQVADALLALSDPKSYAEKYNIPEQPVLLFAMGDGNHSLATAKAHWEKIKSVTDEKAQSTHPARYALVELVNIHDAALQFEPIHRILFHTSDVESLNKEMTEYYGSEEFGVTKVESIEQAKHKVEELRNNKEHAWSLVSKEGIYVQHLSKPKLNLEVASLQGFLDPFIQKSGSKIDYVHGDDVVLDLGTKDGNLGFLLPDVPKNGFFRSIICDGVLPRKTFSMGEADEKRYYTECRRIVP